MASRLRTHPPRHVFDPCDIQATPTPSPPPSPSHSYDAASKHIHQLQTYQRDPFKTPSTPTSASTPVRRLSAQLNVSNVVWGLRRLSAIEEGFVSDKDGHRKHKRRRSILTLIVWVVALGMGYSIVTRSHHLLSSISRNTPEEGFILQDEVPAHGIQTQGRTHQHMTTRASVPSHILSQLPAHTVSQDGLLWVNPQSRVHPIYQLIHNARKEWDRKVAGQSKTLQEAVDEYKKRYKMEPPYGFDKWWEYVCKHNVQLPDEYDQIHKDILPFFALSPGALSRRIHEASQLPDTLTITVKNGNIRTRRTYDRDLKGSDERLQGQVGLVQTIAKDLPDLSVVYGVHDTPHGITSWDHKRELLEKIEDGEYLDEDEEIDTSIRGFHIACPPSSPFRQHSTSSNQTTFLPPMSISSKSFISSHSATMNICNHPSFLGLHGVLTHEPVPQKLTPIFALSKTWLHGDILGIPTDQWVKEVPDVPWEKKRDRKLLWRGSNTGTYHSADTAWRLTHRARLLRLTNLGKEEFSDDAEGLEILPAPKKMGKRTLEEAVKEVRYGEANERYMDLAFTGTPLQCDHQDGTCEELGDEFTWADTMTFEESLNYKYVADVDGNAWSGRFKKLMLSGSLVFKSTIMPEWWTDRIQPWVHYVPVQLGYSDLYDTLSFFDGDLTKTGGEHLLARTIAQEGKRWSETYWREEDMVAYVFRLYLEWGRVVSRNRKEMAFRMKE